MLIIYDTEFPWATGQPDGNGPDACGAFWSGQNLKLDDEDCSESKNFICWVPSELCNTHGFWKYLTGVGGLWTQLPDYGI